MWWCWCWMPAKASWIRTCTCWDLCCRAGVRLVIAINKWDGMDEYDRKQVKESIDRRLDFIPWAECT
jgi:predicted GTPase